MVTNIRILFELCVYDIKQRVAGTAFGLLWLYLSPAMSMLVIWAVFKFGVRGDGESQHTYSLLVGLIGWQLISDVVVVGTGAFIEKPFLVKKIKFPLIFLPIIKVVNSFWIHLPFFLAANVISIVNGQFSFNNLIYFMLMAPFVFAFLMAVVLLLSTIAVFYRDLSSALGVFMQLVFWATPIVWSIPESPKIIDLLERLNPFHFIISSYRACFLNFPFMVSEQIVSFSIVSLTVISIAIYCFRKLKDQFADVL